MKNKLKSFILTSDADFKKHGVDREMRMTSSGVAAKGRKKSLKLHKNSGDKRLIEGFFSTTQKDRVSDVITVKALKGAKDDLLKEGANTVFMNHDTNIPIGRVLSTKVAKQDGKIGLFGKILISKAKDVNNIWIKIKENILNAFSIRLAIKKMEILKDETTGKIEEFRILSMELFEVSVVGLPCNAGCSITSSSGKSFGDIVKQQKTIKRRKSVKKKSRSKSNTKTQTSFLKELVSGAMSEMKDELKSLIKHSGKSEEEIAIETAQELLKSKGLLPASQDEELTEDQKEIANLKKQLADSKKSDEDEELTEDQKEIAKLKKQLSESKGRKGGEENEADEDDSNDDSVKKSLKSADDQDTITYVCHIMDENNSIEHDALSDAEKEKAKSLYMECMFATAMMSEA